MDIEFALRDEIGDKILKLNKLEVGTEQYKLAVDALVPLIDKAIQMDKIERELKEQVESRKATNELEERKLKAEKIDRIVKNVLTGVSIGSNIWVVVWGATHSWEFEKTGTVSTLIGRLFMNRLVPKI
jgi:hypothetical protein